MKHKKFKDIDVKKTVYVVNNKTDVEVKYKLFNNNVMIDLKDIIDKILDDQGIGNYKTEKIEIRIPYDANKVVTGNTMVLGIDNKRFTLRLQALEVIPSKQQKIDYDNTHPHRWAIPQWLKLLEHLYYEYYGFKAIELDLRADSGQFKRGKIYGQINNLKKKILSLKAIKCTEVEIVDYLNWIFTNKSGKTSLNLGLIQSDALIQEWVIYKRKYKPALSQDRKKRKWD